jgi:hypothetical protein
MAKAASAPTTAPAIEPVFRDSDVAPDSAEGWLSATAVEADSPDDVLLWLSLGPIVLTDDAEDSVEREEGDSFFEVDVADSPVPEPSLPALLLPVI